MECIIGKVFSFRVFCPEFDSTVYRILCESLRFGQSDDIYDLSQKKETMIQKKIIWDMIQSVFDFFALKLMFIF